MSKLTASTVRSETTINLKIKRKVCVVVLHLSSAINYHVLVDEELATRVELAEVHLADLMKRVAEKRASHPQSVANSVQRQLDGFNASLQATATTMMAMDIDDSAQPQIEASVFEGLEAGVCALHERQQGLHALIAKLERAKTVIDDEERNSLASSKAGSEKTTSMPASKSNSRSRRASRQFELATRLIQQQ